MEVNKKSPKKIKKIKLIQLPKRRRVCKKPIKKAKKAKKAIKMFSKKYKLLYLLISFIIVIISYKYLLKRKAFDEFKPHEVFIEAHRGVNREVFQNTKEAILLAIKYGLDSFETDVWLSGDKVLVLVHGGFMGDISGYYNAHIKVTNANWDKLSKLRTRRGNFSMPRLDEIMQLTKNKIFMNLEIKDPRCDIVFPEIIKLIVKYDYFNQIAISSFNHRYYQKVLDFNANNKYGKKLVFGFLHGAGFNSHLYQYNQRRNSINILWSKISKSVCRKAHAKGMAVFVWFYMGVKETYHMYKKLFDSGIDIICSNEPVKAKIFRRFYYRNKTIPKNIMKKYFS